ncbi:MAG: fumarate hydratase class II [Gammaproteobacteria bacterium]|nr:class II fumarate hydratase [SAR86 cluster bacterium]GIS75866.1 MAG: fumarate hydratase class II [Gammaproteobacteria bacterium]
MAKKRYRTEKDSLGEVKIPFNALWGPQTQRAIDNFPVSGITFNFPFGRSFLKAMGVIKEAAARANKSLKLIDAKRARGIIKASKEVWSGKHDDQFPVDIFQTGSGTSTNMNANEVIGKLATKYCGVEVDPNDHVNMSQSSNDVIPTAINISCHCDLELLLLPALEGLIQAIDDKSKKLEGVTKTGRTHLMDAMPIDMSQELNAWKSQLLSAQESLLVVTDKLLFLPQGGTAVGTGINAHPRFTKEFAKEVSKLGKVKAKPSNDFFRSLSAQDTSLQVSGELRNLATILMKISNDLRWMNSGPLTGLGEIELKALQPGSSIMPGKVNPVIPESVAMVCADVIGNDTTVAIAAQSGNFQLNVMLPLVAYNVLKSINILSGALTILANKAIKTFKVNNKNIADNLKRNPILVTALNPVIGYAKAADIAKKAYREGRPILDVALEETNLSRKRLEKLLDPANLTKGGIKK